MENKSSFGIFGIIALIIVIFLVYQFFKILIWVIPIVLLIIIVLAILLIRASKKDQGSSSDLENQIRDNLSRIRRHIFKSENNIQRALSAVNLLLSNKYAKLLDAQYSAKDFILNYETIKANLEQKLEPQEFQKFEKVVLGYKSMIEIEQEKISMLNNTKQEYDALQKRLKELKGQEKDMRMLDKNLTKIEQSQFETTAEQTYIYTNYTLDDLKNELEYKNEYLKQLENLKVNYTDEVNLEQLQQYKETLKGMKK